MNNDNFYLYFMEQWRDIIAIGSPVDIEDFFERFYEACSSLYESQKNYYEIKIKKLNDKIKELKLEILK